jgi:hypothetical protein
VLLWLEDRRFACPENFLSKQWISRLGSASAPQAASSSNIYGQPDNLGLVFLA